MHKGKASVLGKAGEKFFAEFLDVNDIKYEFKDESWYDFLIEDEIRVEVKSCCLSTRYVNNGNRRHRMGNFDFKLLRSRQMQYDENIWICFILHHMNQRIFVGFVKARKLDKRRWIPVHLVRPMNPKTPEAWVNHVKEVVKRDE